MTERALSSDTDDSSEKDAGVRMSLSVTDAEAARDLLVCLGDNEGISLSVDCVARESSPPCVLTIDDLSERQLDTAEIAVKRGYYEKPREASLADLAEEFDVSKSAISQRLTQVERKLVRSLVESCRSSGYDASDGG